MILVFAAPPVKGSAEGGITSLLTEATISTTEAGYQFAIKLDKAGNLMSFKTLFKNRTLTVPEGEIPKLKDVDLRQVHVKAPHDKSLGLQESVILIIPFEQELREDPEDQDKADLVHVSNVIRIEFHDGEFLGWEMSVSLGEKSNAWSLTFKDLDKAITDNGKEVGLNNPYWTHNTPAYSTPWSKEK